MDDVAGCSEACLDRPEPAVSRATTGLLHPAGRLAGRVALITGGDTSLGRATATLFAREGADIAFTHLAVHDEADQLVRVVEREGRACLALAGDLGDPAFCEDVVRQVVDRFGRVDVLVNNLDPRHSRSSFFALFYLTRRLLPHLRHRPGASILNADAPAPRPAGARDPGGEALGAVTRSLAHNLAGAEIRVNAVAPGLADADARAADLVFLASDDAAEISGEVVGAGRPAAPPSRRQPRPRRAGPEDSSSGGSSARRRRRARR